MTRPHNVLYISPVGERGGAETTLLNLLRHHDRRRFAPQVALLKAGPLVGEIGELDVRATVIPVARFRRVTDTVAAVFALRRIIRREHIDVVFGNMSMGHVYGGLARLGTAAKAVWFQHGIVDEPDGIDHLAARLPASAIFVCSTTAANAQARLCSIPTVVVGGGVDLTRFARIDGPGVIRRELGVNSDACLIACVGRLQRWKGQSLFLKAMAKILEAHPKVHVLVVGGTLFGLEEAYAAELRAEAMALSGCRRIHFLGHRNDIAAILGDVDLLVHCPLKPEPFGLVLIEAMAMGVPVVATPTAGAADIVVDEKTVLLVPTGDVQALTEAVARLVLAPETRKAMGIAGRFRAETQFGAAALTRRVERELMEVLGWTE